MDLFEAVSRSRQADQEALHHLFTAYYSDVYRTAYLVTRSPQLAEEAAQEAFIRAFNRISTLKEPEKFPSWIRAIVGHCAIDILRREKNTFAHEDPASLADQSDSSLALFPAPETAWEKAEQREMVRTALAELEPMHRQVLVLRYYCDMEVSEIASALSCPVGTVKSRLHRGIKALQRHLTEHRKQGLCI